MKSIKVPYLDILDEISIENASDVLEKSGKHDNIAVLNWPNEFGYRPVTDFYIARSKNSIFIKYSVSGTDLKAVYTQDQSNVHKDSCVEFFCMPEGSEKYTNFEFNCIGTCSASSRKSRSEDVVLFSEAEMLTIERSSSLPKEAFEEKAGEFEWDLTVKIPFKLMNLDSEKLPDYIRANFYKCADETNSPHFVSWAPISTKEPDFHRPEYFGKLEF